MTIDGTTPNKSESDTPVTRFHHECPGTLTLCYVLAMARFKVVHSSSWEKNMCSLFFESDEEELALSVETALRDGSNEEYQVIDSWNRSSQFPTDVKPLFKTMQDVSQWLAKIANN